MSLINDALKKAQSQRAGSPIPGPTPAPAPGPAAIPTAPRKGKTPLSKTILIGATASLLCTLLSVAVTLYILKDDPAPAPPVVTSTPPTPAPTVIQPLPEPAPLIAVVAATPPSSIVSVPVTPAPVEPAPLVTLAPAPSPTPPVIAPPSVPAASRSPVAPTTAAAATSKQTARVQAFIGRLRVNSIRISENGNKAIINERLFRANDVIDPALGLKLIGIETNQLTFVDEAGNQYFRHF